jgi:hypothetical protein
MADWGCQSDEEVTAAMATEGVVDWGKYVMLLRTIGPGGLRGASEMHQENVHKLFNFSTFLSQKAKKRES